MSFQDQKPWASRAIWRLEGQMDLDRVLAGMAEKIEPHRGKGKAADYIPALASMDPRKFGLAIATKDGVCHKIGDAEECFSIQSISKVFTLSLALLAGRANMAVAINQDEHRAQQRKEAASTPSLRAARHQPQPRAQHGWRAIWSADKRPPGCRMRFNPSPDQGALGQRRALKTRRQRSPTNDRRI